MADYHRHRRINNLANAFVNQAVNPFAQLTRVADRGTSSRPYDPNTAPSHFTVPKPYNFVTPEKAPKPAQGPSIEPKNRVPKMNRIEDDEDMELAVGLSQSFSNQVAAAPAAAARSSGETSSNNKKGNTETKVARQRPHYGLPETVTQVLTGTDYFSWAVTNISTEAYRIRLTSLIDREVISPNAPTIPGTINNGIWNTKIARTDSNSWTAGIAEQFPTSTRDNAQWKAWFTKAYSYYHFIGLEYEITFNNPLVGINYGATVGMFIDTFGPNNASQVHPLDATIAQMEQWPDVQWVVVPSVDNSNQMEDCTRTVKGYYYPQKVRQNVENDEDVDTWTKVGSSPQLSEILTLRLFRSAFSDRSFAALNVRVKWRAIVQFKDLAPAFRWPSNQTAISLIAPTDILAGTT